MDALSESPMMYKPMLNGNPGSPFDFLCTTANSPLLNNAYTVANGGRDFQFTAFHPHHFFDYALVNCGTKNSCSKLNECDSNGNGSSPLFSVTTPPPNLLMTTDPKSGKVDSSMELKIGEWIDPKAGSENTGLSNGKSISGDEKCSDKTCEDSEDCMNKSSYLTMNSNPKKR